MPCPAKFSSARQCCTNPFFSHVYVFLVGCIPGSRSRNLGSSDLFGFQVCHGQVPDPTLNNRRMHWDH